MTAHAARTDVETSNQPTHWTAIIAVAAGSFTLVVSEFLPVGLLPVIAADLDVSDGRAGLMITGPGLLAALAAPIVTIVAGRVNRRMLLVGLGVVLLASNLIAAMADTFTVMLIGRMLLGIGVGGFWTVGVSVAPRLASPRMLARATAVISSGITIGTVASLPLGPLIAKAAGWHMSFFVAAAVAAAVVIAQCVALPGMRTQIAPTPRTLLHVFANTGARVGMLASVVIFFGHFAAYTYLVPYLHDVAAVPAAWITLCLIIYGVAGIVGNFVAGASAARRVKATMVAMVVVLAGSVLMLSLIGTTPITATILVCLWGFAWGGVPVVLQLWMLRSLGTGVEGGFALFVSVSQLALAAGSSLGGVVVDGVGVQTDLILAAAIALSCLIAVGVVRTPAAVPG
jgi:predicted MFS family arabinose efflux permease